MIRYLFFATVAALFLAGVASAQCANGQCSLPRAAAKVVTAPVRTVARVATAPVRVVATSKARLRIFRR